MAGTVIKGRALSSDGGPIVEARVYFTEAPVPMPDIATLTGGDGRFTLAAPAAGTYRIECSADGFEPGTVTVDVDDRPEVRVVIELVKS